MGRLFETAKCRQAKPLGGMNVPAGATECLQEINSELPCGLCWPKALAG